MISLVPDRVINPKTGLQILIQIAASKIFCKLFLPLSHFFWPVYLIPRIKNLESSFSPIGTFWDEFFRLPRSAFRLARGLSWALVEAYSFQCTFFSLSHTLFLFPLSPVWCTSPTSRFQHIRFRRNRFWKFCDDGDYFFPLKMTFKWRPFFLGPTFWRVLKKKLLIAKIFNSCSSINFSDAAGLTKSSEDKKLTIWFDF